MPPHVGLLDFAGSVRLDGAGINSTFVECLGRLKMLKMLASSIISFSALTLRGVVPGFLDSSTPATLTPEFFPRVYLNASEWWAASSDLRDSGDGYVTTYIKAALNSGAITLLTIGGHQPESDIVFTTSNITFPGRFLLRMVTDAYGFGSLHLFIDTVVHRASPDTHEIEDLYNSLIAKNGPSRTDCYNADLEDSGLTYRGNASTTVTGFECKAWDDPSNFPSSYLPTLPGQFSSTQGNFCRSPRYWTGGPWCYSTNPNFTYVSWENCPIDACPGTGTNNTAAVTSASGPPLSPSARKATNHAGAISGGVIGGVALLCALAAAAVLLARKRARGAHAASTDAATTLDPSLVKPRRASQRSLGPFFYRSPETSSASHAFTTQGPAVHIEALNAPVSLSATHVNFDHTSDSSIGPPPDATIPDLEGFVRPPLDAKASDLEGFMSNVAVPGDVQAPFTELRCDKTAAEIAAAGGMAAVKQQVALVDRVPGFVVHGEYTFLPNFPLCVGGQGAVKFAGKAGSRTQYAIKYFASRQAYRNEEAFYMNKSLAAILPPYECMGPNTDGRWRDPLGRPLPPFLIMEKGEALHEVIRRRVLDVISAMQIMCHVVKAVVDLHSAGFVHRDLKPSNILWLPSQHRWTTMDFGCAAKHGEMTHTSLTLAYAAPETARAYRDKDRLVRVDRAVDTFALGVIAYELFTGQRAFQRSATAEMILDALTGEPGTLRWEASGAESEAALDKLGSMRPQVLAMLHRDPAQRASLPDVYSQWMGMFRS